MSHRRARFAVPALLAAICSAGCLAPQAPLAPARAGTATVKVHAGFAAPAARRVTGVPAPKWTPEDVEYVRFDVYVVGGAATPYLTQFVTGADIRTAGVTLTLTSLAANTTYRIEARAYDDALGMQDEDFNGTPDGFAAATLLSIAQAPETTWSSTVAVGGDNEPTLATPIALQLIDRVFDGTATLPGPEVLLKGGDCTFDQQGVVSTVVGGGGVFQHGDAYGLDTAVFDAGHMVRASDGTLYVAGGHQVWMVTRDRDTFLLGGYGIPANGVGYKGETGFDTPHGLALSADESELYVADFYNGRIVAIDLESNDLFEVMPETAATAGFSDPVYSRVVAGGIEFQPASQDGTINLATFNLPTGLALAVDGSLLVTERDGRVIRRIDLNSADPAADSAYVTTIAGLKNASGASDDALNALNARFRAPYDIERFQDGFLIVDQDALAPALRKLTPLATGGWGLTTFATKSAFAADASGDTIIEPFQLAVDHADRIWFGDRDKAAAPVRPYLRCLDPSKTGDARLRTWLGKAEADGVPYKDGHIDDASFSFWGLPTDFHPIGVCVDPSGTVFFSDPSANSVRKLQ